MPTRYDTSCGDDSSAWDPPRHTICGEPQSNALCRIICCFPGNPELLQPEAQCESAASKLTSLMKENHVLIPTGVTRTSWKRQELLIIGKDSSSILGLIVFPTVISANHKKELMVLAQALQAPLIIPENTPIAKAIPLPPNTMEKVLSTVSQQTSAECADMKTHVLWIQQIKLRSTTNDLQFDI